MSVPAEASHSDMKAIKASYNQFVTSTCSDTIRLREELLSKWLPPQASQEPPPEVQAPLPDAPLPDVAPPERPSATPRA